MTRAKRREATEYMREWRKGQRKKFVTILGIRVRWRTLERREHTA